MSAIMPTTAPLTFTPPGPGPWDLDPVHFPRPVTRYWAEMHPPAFSRGYADMCTYYGLPFGTRVMSYVNGFAYGQMQPLPPEEVPARLARAAEVFDKKVWRAQIREWDEVAKPAAVRAHLELSAVEPDLLPDQELADYLERCRDHHAAMIAQHMRYTGTATIPPGDLLAHVQAWTALPAAQLLGMMRGASPISGGRSAQHDRLVAALRADPAAAAQLLDGADAARAIDELRHEDTEVGWALDEFLEFTGYRLLDGFDISGRYALELPDVLLRSIRSALEDDGAPASDGAQEIAEIRARVPEQQRGLFDELVEEARLGYRIRDERGVYSDIWASGLMRRAALSAGRRLVARGRLHAAEHFVFAGFDEMCALLAGSPSPTADDLAQRHAFHTSHTAKEAPAHLGDPPPAMPDPSSFAPPVARLMAAVSIAFGQMFEESEAPHDRSVIRGLPASAGTREGPARRVNGPADFDRIRKGDVLLTEATTEAFNILLPLLQGIVTDSGGALSHAAIVAREYGIPAVVGTREGTLAIPDGSYVRVDGDTGEVTVLS